MSNYITYLFCYQAYLFDKTDMCYNTYVLQSTVPIVWKLEDYLAARGKTRYELASAMEGEKQSNLTTLYRLNSARRLDYSTLERLIRGLNKLTGEQPTVGDLLEFRE